MKLLNADELIEWQKPRCRVESASSGTKRQSVSQEWLDRIAAPGPLWFRTWLKWLNRFLAKPAEYPNEDLKRWAEETGTEIRELTERMKTLAAADSWETPQAPEWMKLHDQRMKASAFQSACMETLNMRQKAHKLAAQPPTAGHTSSPTSKAISYQPENDPFAWE